MPLDQLPRATASSRPLPVQTRGLPRISLDILLQVFDILVYEVDNQVDGWKTSRLSKRAIGACALVSRSLLKPSRSILFRQIFITDAISMERLVHLMNCNTYLARYIKYIRVDELKSPPAFVDLMERATHVEEVHIWFMTWSDFHEMDQTRLCAMSCLPSIKLLALVGVKFHHLDDLIRLTASKRSSLDELHLCGVMIEDDSETRDLNFNTHKLITISKLKLSLGGPALVEWRRWLSPDGLRHLDIAASDYDDVSHMVSLVQASHNIEKLVISPLGAEASKFVNRGPGHYTNDR
jgi:hypothetical protein